jgi:hypothetical protein
MFHENSSKNEMAADYRTPRRMVEQAYRCDHLTMQSAKYAKLRRAVSIGESAIQKKGKVR